MFQSVSNIDNPVQPLKRAFSASNTEYDLHIATDASDEEMDGQFLAYCLDENEWLYVNGSM